MDIDKWSKVKITATGLVPNLGRGNTFGGIITQSIGTLTTLTAYDDIAANAGNLIMPITAAAATNVAGVFTSPFGGANGTLTTCPPVMSGLELERGLYVTIGGTGAPTFYVLYK